MIAANIYFIATLVLGLLLITGTVEGRDIITAHAHVGLLGWISLTIIGAIYEQVPNLTAADLYSERTASWAFWVYNIGLVGLVASFINGGPSGLMVVSGAALLIGIYAFSGNVFMTVKNRRAPNPIVKIYAATVGYFVLASTLGGLLVLGKAGIVDPIEIFGATRYVTAHAHLGLLGWASLIIIGALAWMFPMVVMRDIYSHRLIEAVFWGFNLGTLGLAIGLMTQGIGTMTVVSGGVLLLAAALFAFNLFMTATRKQIKMEISAQATEAPFFYASVAYFVLVCALGALMVFQPDNIKGLSRAHAHLALLGWVSVTIFGGMYHLVPMLSWTMLMKKAANLGPDAMKDLPRSLNELYSQKLARGIFYFINIGIIGLAVGMYLDLTGVATAGGMMIFVFGTAFSAAMFKAILKGL
jgi:cbb3-type cytochrome oxidase subunit 1